MNSWALRFPLQLTCRGRAHLKTRALRVTNPATRKGLPQASVQSEEPRGEWRSHTSNGNTFLTFSEDNVDFRPANTGHLVCRSCPNNVPFNVNMYSWPSLISAPRISVPPELPAVAVHRTILHVLIRKPPCSQTSGHICLSCHLRGHFITSKSRDFMVCVPDFMGVCRCNFAFL
jgi:hypothetical protein